MKKYLKYLLTDIETAKKNKPPSPKNSDDTSEIFRSPVEYLDAPLQNMSVWFGLDARAFPPVERWESEDLTLIIAAMSQLWQVYNYEPVFPDGMGDEQKYKLFVKTLSEPVPYLESSLIMIDFCDSDVSTCALEEFCICQEIVDFVEELPHKSEIIIAEPDRKVEVSASMQRYYEQLLNDLNEALQYLPNNDDNDEEDDYDAEEEEDFLGLFEKKSFDKIEKEEEEKKPLAEWVNVSQAVFPKLEQISTEMVIEIVRAIEKIWWYAGFVPFFPDGLNIEFKYKLYREHWNREVPWPTDESVYLGFCDDDEDNCIYGAEMCTCAMYKLSYGDEEEYEVERKEQSLNFEIDETNFDDFLDNMGFEDDFEDEDDDFLPF